MIQIVQLHGTDKKLYELVAPLVMSPEVLKQNYNILLEMLATKPSESEEVLEAWRQYRVKVHAMKTSAAMIGAVSLSSFAKLLEDFSKNLII